MYNAFPSACDFSMNKTSKKGESLGWRIENSFSPFTYFNPMKRKQ